MSSLIKKNLPQIIQTLGRIAPEITARIALHLFLRPPRYARPEREKPTWLKAMPLRLPSGAATRVLNPGFDEVWFIHGWAGRGSQFYVMAEAVAQAGFTAVMWDGPAHGDTPGSQTNMIEFSRILKWDLASREKSLHALVGHSFGGAASCYLVSTQSLSPRKLVEIAAPADLRRIFEFYFKRIQLPPIAQDRFLRLTYKLTGIDIMKVDFSGLAKANNTAFMIIHDENDKEVRFLNAEEFYAIRPDAELLKTQNLGHRRILQSEFVTEELVRFLKS